MKPASFDYTEANYSRTAISTAGVGNQTVINDVHLLNI